MSSTPFRRIVACYSSTVGSPLHRRPPLPPPPLLILSPRLLRSGRFHYAAALPRDCGRVLLLGTGKIGRSVDAIEGRCTARKVHIPGFL